MTGYLLVFALLMVSQTYLTFMVVTDCAISRNRKIFRLCLIWLLPIIGINLVNMCYSRSDSRS